MVCSNCGSSFEKSKKFCPACGYSVKPSAEDRLDSGEFLGAPANTVMMRAEADDDYALSAFSYRQPATPAEHNDDIGFEDKPKNKKNMRIKLLAPAVALTLVVSIVVAAWNIFLAVNPQVRIAKAFEKTLFASKGITFELSEDGEKTAAGNVVFGKNTFASDLFIETADGNRIICDNGRLFVDYGGSCYAVDMPDVCAELAKGIEEIESGNVTKVVDALEDKYGVEVKPEQVANWAENLIKNKTLNEKVIKELWNTVAVSVIATHFDIDDKDVPKYSDIKSIISGALKKGIGSEAFKLINTQKKNGVKYYECEVVPSEIVEGMLGYVLDCKKLQPILDAKNADGTTVRETVENKLELIESGKYNGRIYEKVEVRFGIKGGYLVSLKAGNIELEIREANKKYDAAADYEKHSDAAQGVKELSLDALAEKLLNAAKFDKKS